MLEEIRCLSGHRGWVNAVAFSPCGRFVLSGGQDAAVRLWDWQNACEVRRFEGHTGGVTGVAFSPGGWTLASAGGQDGTVRVWRAKSGECIWAFNTHTWLVSSVTFSPDRRYLLTTGADHLACLWSIRSGKLIAAMRGHTDWVSSATFSPDGERIVTTSWDGSVRLWEGGQTVARYDLNTWRVHTAVFLSREQVLIGSENPYVNDPKPLRLWNVAEDRMVVFPGVEEGVQALAALPDGRLALSGGADHPLRLWDTFQGREIHRFPSEKHRVLSLAVSRDGRYAVSGGLDQTVRIWDLGGYADSLAQSLQNKEQEGKSL